MKMSSLTLYRVPYPTRDIRLSQTLKPGPNKYATPPPDSFRANLLPQLHGLPTSMIRFPTHDGRGGFTLALSTPSEREESSASHHTAIPTQSLKLSSAKALSTHASTSSSILDDALPRQAHPSTDLSQRIHAWAQEQQLYTRLRHKRRKLSMDADQRSRRHGLEGWLWRFVSRLIGIDDQLLQIVLGEKLVDSTEKSISDGTSFWESLLQHTSTENHLASPFPPPHFQRIFRQQYEIPTSTPQATAPNNRPTRQAPSPWGETGRQRQTNVQNPGSSWSSFPPDPISAAPFQPSPLRIQPSPRTESSHAPWGIEDNDILSTSTEIPDDYWDRELTIPIVWHIVKNFISTRLPTRHQQDRLEDTAVRSCKEESLRWDDPGDENRGYYWHESVDGASSVGLGLGGLGTWAEV